MVYRTSRNSATKVVNRIWFSNIHVTMLPTKLVIAREVERSVASCGRSESSSRPPTIYTAMFDQPVGATVDEEYN